MDRFRNRNKFRCVLLLGETHRLHINDNQCRTMTPDSKHKYRLLLHNALCCCPVCGRSIDPPIDPNNIWENMYLDMNGGSPAFSLFSFHVALTVSVFRNVHARMKWWTSITNALYDLQSVGNHRDILIMHAGYNMMYEY